VSDIDTAAADGLKVLDPKRPIREADIAQLFDYLVGNREQTYRAAELIWQKRKL